MSGRDQDWQVGDLALRIGGPGWFDLDAQVDCDEGPAPGSVNKVIGCYSERQGIGLRFEDWSEFVFSAKSFRKIRPHIPDAEDDETIALLTGKPVRTPELV